MKIKTSELTGDALNYASAISEGGEDGYAGENEHALYLLTGPDHKGTLDFLTGAHGRSIVERELIEITRGGSYAEHFWKAKCNSKIAYGSTPLIAAMRCYVASKLGDEVEIPQELLGEVI
jgi:hypothetical protein